MCFLLLVSLECNSLPHATIDLIVSQSLVSQSLVSQSLVSQSLVSQASALQVGPLIDKASHRGVAGFAQ